LDLDHTLLHAVQSAHVIDSLDNYGTVTLEWTRSVVEFIRFAVDDDVIRFFIPGIPTEHVLKLRPGLSTFLHELSFLYELHIYTHGTRKYAEKVAEIIDPDHSLFRHRIIARTILYLSKWKLNVLIGTDTPDVSHKSLQVGQA
jgi:RNA polymerase II subunit A-like phosphatase